MRVKKAPSEPFEVNELRELSARLGSNPLLVQASSGNTSIKIGDVLWIKASGKWLIHAQADDFLVPVNLTNARRCLREDLAIPETEATTPSGLGASIETAMHAILPQKVVIHVHSISAIAWAVRQDASRRLSERLAGLHWQWIPYTPSGAPLAKKISCALSCAPQTDVLVLGNHGLVVCGDSCRAAAHLLADVETRLAIEPRAAPKQHSVSLHEETLGMEWRLPSCVEVHALASDHISRRILSGGILYPCQAMFLPETALLRDSPFAQGSGYFQGVEQRKLLSISDHGVLCRRHMTGAEEEMLIGLVNVLQRIDEAAPVRYLTALEVTEALNIGSASYRRFDDTNGLSSNRADLGA